MAPFYRRIKKHLRTNETPSPREEAARRKHLNTNRLDHTHLNFASPRTLLVAALRALNQLIRTLCAHMYSTLHRPLQSPARHSISSYRRSRVDHCFSLLLSNFLSEQHETDAPELTRGNLPFAKNFCWLHTRPLTPHSTQIDVLFLDFVQVSSSSA